MAARSRRWQVRDTADERGQAVVLSIVWMVVLLGLAGLVIDVGGWYKSQRDLQAQADASALAGAQDLPVDVTSAPGLAQTYATKNGYTLPSNDITISGTYVPNDSINVKVASNSPTYFSKIFGIASVHITADATARSDLIGAAQYVAPIAVNIAHPLLSGFVNGVKCPCYQQDTTLPLGKTGAPGAFALIDLNAKGGTGASDIANWILNGFPDALSLGDYFSNTGAKWDNSSIQAAIAARLNSVLMFPVYDTLGGTGVNAQYHIIAWVGFYITGMVANGISGSITGHFTSIDWEGLPAPQPTNEPDLGARVISLVH